MNIFYLDKDPTRAAQYMCDTHVVKMTLEYAQILSTIIQTQPICNGAGYVEGLYKPTHVNHPSVLWAADSPTNLNWFVKHALATADEYTYRYRKKHKSGEVIELAAHFLDMYEPVKINSGWTEPAQCMPDHYKVSGDSVKAYRNYYLGEKKHFAKWAHKRKAPYWWR